MSKIPDMDNRKFKSTKLFCKSVFNDYSQVELNKEYSYEQLINLIRDVDGNKLIAPKNSGSKKILLEALAISLTIEATGETKSKRYIVRAKQNYTSTEKDAISEAILQNYLLSKDNKNGAIYETILCLLYLKGKSRAEDFGPLVKYMEFSMGSWEVEVGMTSRVFQQMLYKGNNVLTQTIMGNLLRLSVDEAKKNLFSRAMEFISNDPDIIKKSFVKVLMIDETREIDRKDIDALRQAAGSLIEYNGKLYKYEQGYANDILVAMIDLIEKEAMRDLGFEDYGSVVAAGKYKEFHNIVKEKIVCLNPKYLTIDEPYPNSGRATSKKEIWKESTAEEMQRPKILHYWKSYEIGMSAIKLEQRIQAIINKQKEDLDDEDESSVEPQQPYYMGINYMNDYTVVLNRVIDLKKELNQFIEMKISRKISLDGFDLRSENGKALTEEILWFNYFNKYATAKVNSESETEGLLFDIDEGFDEQATPNYVFNKKGWLMGVTENGFNYIRYAPDNVRPLRTNDLVAFTKVYELANKFIMENKSLQEIKDQYGEKMNNLIANSLIISRGGEINTTGPDFDEMNDKIIKLMKTQYKSQEDAIRISYEIFKRKR